MKQALNVTWGEWIRHGISQVSGFGSRPKGRLCLRATVRLKYSTSAVVEADSANAISCKSFC